MIPINYPLADVDGVFNAVRLVGDFVGPVMLYGRGAGMEATASAVMGDVMAIARNLLAGAGARTPAMAYLPECVRDLPIKAMDDIVSQSICVLRRSTSRSPCRLPAASASTTSASPR
jgi:homoserine dehydrogenase